MRKRTFVICFILMMIAGSGYFLLRPKMPVRTGEPFEQGSVRDIAVERPSITVHGERLVRVEVWVATVQIGPGEYKHIGNATLVKTDAGGMQTWQYRLSEQPMQISELFARGYVEHNAPVGERTLPETGEELITALWGIGPSTPPAK